MVWRYTFELTQSQLYSLISKGLFLFVIFFALILLAIKFKLNQKLLKKFTRFSLKHHRTIFSLVLILFIISIILFGFFKFTLWDLDRNTKISIDEKIVIIELDDWWNFQDTEKYLGVYGYTFERFRAVTNIIDRYNFTATMGVTPYIFVEDLNYNFALRDDPEMIDYIREMEEKGYEIGMHGYNHCRNEYYCPKYEEVWYNVNNGKRELEAIFGVELVSYFPPGNQWTTEQYLNVKKAGFKVIGNTHVPKAYFDGDVIITQKGYDPIYVYKWYLLDFRHTSFDEWIGEYDKTNLFILQLHQNTFDSKEKLDDLDKFLNHVKKDGAKVMTYKEFYNYISEKRKMEGRPLTGKIVVEVSNEI
jgi:predicted deacetylase